MAADKSESKESSPIVDPVDEYKPRPYEEAMSQEMKESLKADKK